MQIQLMLTNDNGHNLINQDRSFQRRHQTRYCTHAWFSNEILSKCLFCLSNINWALV